MLTEEKRPYEFLARWNTQTGSLQGAHVGFSTVILRDGEFVTETLDSVQSVDVGQGAGFPLLSILDALHVGALVALDAKDAELVATSELLLRERARVAELEADVLRLSEALTAATSNEAAGVSGRQE